MITDRELFVPTQVVFDKTVKDFALGENSMVILTGTILDIFIYD
jgi:hypothetical protein